MKKFVLLFILLPLCIFSACTSKDKPRDNMITFDKDVYYDEGVFSIKIGTKLSEHIKKL